MVGAQVLGRVLLHEEYFQVLAGHVLIGREEVKPVIWPPGYVTPSRMVQMGVVRFMCPGTYRHRAKRRQTVLLLLVSGQDIYVFWIHLDLSLAPDWLPQSHAFPAPHSMIS